MKVHSCAVVALTLGMVQAVNAQTFAQTQEITINSLGAASPFPSVINVSGVSGPIGSLTVKIHSFNHSRNDDVDILLVGPTGAAVMLLSDAGGTANSFHIALNFEEGAPSLPSGGPFANGTFSPTDFEPGEQFPSPSPIGPYGTSLAVFNGLNANGDWSLFIVDDTAQGSGKIRGWSVTINPIPAPGAIALALAAAMVAARRRR